MCRQAPSGGAAPGLRDASQSVPPDFELNHRYWPRPRQDGSRPDRSAGTAFRLQTLEGGPTRADRELTADRFPVQDSLRIRGAGRVAQAGRNARLTTVAGAAP